MRVDIIAGTGHRPEDCEAEEIVRNKIRQTLQEVRPNGVITGMAAGFDLWLADEALKLGIWTIGARPWAGHEAREEDIELYAHITTYAAEIVNVDEAEEYLGPYMYHKRNEWMVDNATHVLAYLRPDKTSGGTFNCVKYARKVGKPVRNIYA